MAETPKGAGTRSCRRAWSEGPFSLVPDAQAAQAASAAVVAAPTYRGPKIIGSALYPKRMLPTSTVPPPEHLADSETSSEISLGTSAKVANVGSERSLGLIFSVPLGDYKGDRQDEPVEQKEADAPKNTSLVNRVSCAWDGLETRVSGWVCLSGEGAARSAVHGAVLLPLLVADIVFAVEHHGDFAGEEAQLALVLGIALLALYVVLGAWLVASCVLPSAWELSARRLLLPRAGVVLSLVHTALAFVSAGWREAQQLQNGEPGVRAACVAGALQLLTTALYPCRAISYAVLALLSVASLIVLEAASGGALETVVDNVLLLLAVAVTCLATANSRGCPERQHLKGHNVRQVLEGIFQPLTDELFSPEEAGQEREVTTHVGQLTNRLKAAKDRSTASVLDSESKSLLDSVFAFLLTELTDLNSLDRMSMRDVNDLPPMMAEYVQKTLGQGSNERKAVMSQGVISVDGSRQSGGEPSVELLDSPETARPGQVLDARPFLLKSSPAQAVSPLSGERPSPLSTRSMSKESREEQKLGFTFTTPTIQLPTFQENVDNMALTLSRQNREDGLPPPQIRDDLQKALHNEVGLWGCDILKLSKLVDSRPLLAVGGVALGPVLQRLNIEAFRVQCFLDGIEARYVSNPYHNSIHGADVMNNMLYFLRLQNTALANLEPIEHLAALTAAAAHDVGHDGFSNRFHVSAETPLTQLYNDQSPLENMHCTITFTVLRSTGTNFLDDLEASLRTTFRAHVTQMILETDLAKHIQTLSRFRQELLRGDFDASHPHTFAQRKELATIALKCSDVAHSTKPFHLHIFWTLRINAEFFRQGDTERGMGLACSPFCDRAATHVAESQRGFFDFIVSPLFKAMSEHLSNPRYQEEVMPYLEMNYQFWKHYNGADFNYEEPAKNADMLLQRYCAWRKPHYPNAERRASWSPPPERRYTYTLESVSSMERDKETAQSSTVNDFRTSRIPKNARKQKTTTDLAGTKPLPLTDILRAQPQARVSGRPQSSLGRASARPQTTGPNPEVLCETVSRKQSRSNSEAVREAVCRATSRSNSEAMREAGHRGTSRSNSEAQRRGLAEAARCASRNTSEVSPDLH